METNACNQAIAAIPYQYHIADGVKRLHPVEYHAKTLTATQRNWPIHDEELFVIEDCFWKWRDWVAGVYVNLYTSHQGLQYFNTNQKLNSRQATWYLRMSEFNYQIYYRPETKMGEPDGLSKCLGEEKFGMEAKSFEAGQLMVVEKGDEEDAEDVEVDKINVAGWEKKDELWVVPPEHRL